jgi:molybdate transport system substrate-binding protein
MSHLADEYQKTQGQAITLSFGSSGNMARQIQQGLRADIFMSADEAFVLQLANAGLTHEGGKGILYALGRVALYLAPGSTIKPDAQLQGLRKDWEQVKKFAIANPEHAPYGRAAQETLQSLNMWSLVQQRMVMGDNIAQATQFVTTGAAQAGITALSLVQAPTMQGRGQYVVLPEHLHRPLRQRMVLMRGASQAAQVFFNWLQRAPARAVMAQYGFLPPS